jgi:hypothetical protein
MISIRDATRRMPQTVKRPVPKQKSERLTGSEDGAAQLVESAICINATENITPAKQSKSHPTVGATNHREPGENRAFIQGATLIDNDRLHHPPAGPCAKRQTVSPSARLVSANQQMAHLPESLRVKFIAIG